MTAEIICLERYRHANTGSRSSASSLLGKRPLERGLGMASMLRRQEPRWADHRDAPRQRVQGKWMSRVTLNGRAARLEDVSRAGLKVWCDVDAQPGAEVVIAILGCPPLSARVIWRRNGEIGLEAPLASMPPMAS